MHRLLAQSMSTNILETSNAAHLPLGGQRHQTRLKWSSLTFGGNLGIVTTFGKSHRVPQYPRNQKSINSLLRIRPGRTLVHFGKKERWGLTQLPQRSHSGLLEPRGAITVRKEPGVRDRTTWSVMP
jgi:hypothetical protein